MRSRITRWAIAAIALSLVASAPATAVKKTTKKRKKAAPVATAAPAKRGGGNFTCTGRPNIQLAWRDVTGTVDAKLNVTNVSVTQIYQKVGDALVEQPTVVLTAPNPVGEPDPVSPLVIYRLNQQTPAAAADVDQILTLYQFNLPNVVPAGPTFKAGLYFRSLKGTAGPLTNEFRWSSISSLALGGLFEMDCTYT